MSFPNKPWSMYGLSQNLSIPMDIILNNPEPFPGKKWNWSNVSRRRDITWDMISSHPEIPWDMKLISWHTTIPWETILENLNAGWDCSRLCYRYNVPLDFLLEYSNSAPRISCHKDITIDIARQHMEKIDTYEISRNSAITWDIVSANPEFPWNMDGLSCNPNITVNIITENPQPPWGNWILHKLAYNENIPISNILNLAKESGKDLSLIYKKLSLRYDISIDIMNQYINENWDWEVLYPDDSRITWDDIFNNPTYPWNWENLQYNDDFPWNRVAENWNIISKYIDGEQISFSDDIPWDYVFNASEPLPGVSWKRSYLSSRPDLTWETVANNPRPRWGKWSWEHISANNFGKR